MHRIFTIADMLSEILSWMSRAELVATVCVNLLWFTASVPKIWRNAELKTILCVLGSGRVPSTTYHWVLKAPTPEKWKRFEIYSYYVQILRGSQREEFALSMAMACRPTTSRHLFPTCRSLTWDIFTDGMFLDLRPVISPTLEHFCLRVHTLEVSFFRRLCESLKATSPTLKYLRLTIALSSFITTKKCQDLFHDLLTFFGPHLTLVQIPGVFNTEGIIQKLYEIPKLSDLVVDFTGISSDLGVYVGNNGREGFRALENLAFQGSQASLCDGFVRRFNVTSLQTLRWYLPNPLSNVDSFIGVIVEYCPQIKVLIVGHSGMYSRYTEPRPVVSWQSIQPLLQCKNLHHLSLHCFQVAMNLKELEEMLTNRATWTGIELYTKNPLSPCDLLLFSKHCPNLVNLGAYVNGFLDFRVMNPSTAIPFPHLMSLDFAYSIFSPNMATLVAAFLFKFCEKPPRTTGWNPGFWDCVSVALSELYIDHSKGTGVPMSGDVKLFIKHVKANLGRFMTKSDLRTFLV